MISFRGAWGATNVTFADTTFDGVNVRVYQPRNMKRRKEMVAGLLFIHGGGWIYGNAGKCRDNRLIKVKGSWNLNR